MSASKAITPRQTKRNKMKNLTKELKSALAKTINTYSWEGGHPPADLDTVEFFNEKFAKKMVSRGVEAGLHLRQPSFKALAKHFNLL